MALLKGVAIWVAASVPLALLAGRLLHATNPDLISEIEAYLRRRQRRSLRRGLGVLTLTAAAAAVVMGTAETAQRLTSVPVAIGDDAEDEPAPQAPSTSARAGSPGAPSTTTSSTAATTSTTDAVTDAERPAGDPSASPEAPSSTTTVTAVPDEDQATWSDDRPQRDGARTGRRDDGDPAPPATTSTTSTPPPTSTTTSSTSTTTAPPPDEDHTETGTTTTSTSVPDGAEAPEAPN